MTPEERAAAAVAEITDFASLPGEGPVRQVDPERPARVIAVAIRAAVAAERGRCAEAVRAYRGVPSRSGILRAVLEPPPDRESLDTYAPGLARGLATVDVFAGLMKARLIEEHPGKGDWDGAHVFWLAVLLSREVGELLAAVIDLMGGPAQAPDLRQVGGAQEFVRRKAANVGNYAMMVADVAAGLGSGERREPGP